MFAINANIKDYDSFSNSEKMSYTKNMYDYFEAKRNAILNGTALYNDEGDALSEEEIDYYLNYKSMLAKQVIELNSYTDEQLDFLNYNKEQKYAIRNFDGSDDMLRSASSNLSVTGKFTSFNKTSSKTTATLSVSFTWNGK